MNSPSRPDDMARKPPFFITASLLVARLALALPDLDLATAAEESARGATMARGAALQKRTTRGGRPTRHPGRR
jgi:hypothetical protein